VRKGGAHHSQLPASSDTSTHAARQRSTDAASGKRPRAQREDTLAVASFRSASPFARVASKGAAASYGIRCRAAGAASCMFASSVCAGESVAWWRQRRFWLWSVLGSSAVGSTPPAAVRSNGLAETAHQESGRVQKHPALPWFWRVTRVVRSRSDGQNFWETWPNKSLRMSPTLEI